MIEFTQGQKDVDQAVIGTVFPSRQNLSQEVATYIKELIATGRLNPGDRVIESKLAKELGLSATPIREAIRQLAGEGIVSIVPNKGPLVRTLSKQDIFEIYSVRSVLEGFAIRVATQTASPEEVRNVANLYEDMKRKLHDDSVSSLLQDSARLHRSIVELSHHSRLISMYDSISFQISLLNRILGRKSTKQKEVDQHLELVEALVQRDPDNAERTLRAHIYRSFQEFTELEEIRAPQQEDLKWF